VDLILDCVGGSYWEQNAEAIAREGRWVLFGLRGGKDVDGSILGTLLRKRVRLEGTTLRARTMEYKGRLTSAFWGHAKPLFESGAYAPVVDSTYPLSDIQAAHEHMESNSSNGKILLRVE
jgi:tumor protein p53-inducible protein 3